MQIIKSSDKPTLGRLAAASASRIIRAAISARGFANVIIATGASQFETLNHLVQDRAIEWGKVTLFHLDEYIDLPVTHLASFQKYLRERFLAHVPPPKTFHFISGAGDPAVECVRLHYREKTERGSVAFTPYLTPPIAGPTSSISSMTTRTYTSSGTSSPPTAPLSNFCCPPMDSPGDLRPA